MCATLTWSNFSRGSFDFSSKFAYWNTIQVNEQTEGHMDPEGRQVFPTSFHYSPSDHVETF